ncbi:MAG: PepSY domain-containing protein [Gluconacetobacter diazotrophicus]|nr:PepSY domain-containing protein [Gluconacetobacter diazotrophicus]
MSSGPRRRFWPHPLTVWRWHFFAGLFCLPFVAFLSLTGAVYLFKPQLDAVLDRPYDRLVPPGTPLATPEQEVRAALAAVPGATLLAFELPPHPGDAARVILDRDGDAIRIYVHPRTLAILHQVREETRFERVVFKLHGQLLLGNLGSAIMEMVASWTIVLVLTGLVLWWPRRSAALPASGPAGSGPGGVVWPRLSAPGRRRWRDLHAVSGAWVSLVLVLFLLSGLPWSFVWGHALARVENAAGRLAAVRDWQIGAVPARDIAAARPVPAPSSMPGMDMDTPAPAATPDALSGLDAVVATAARLGFPPPVLVTPPIPSAASSAGPVPAWRVRSDTEDRPRRIAARVSSAGAVLSVERFRDKGPVERLVGYGVAAHEGHLFGWFNQLLNLLVALLLLAMSLAATVLWLRRRPPGHLGAPPRRDRRLAPGALLLVLPLALLLPELAAALLLLACASALAPRLSRS